MIWTYYACNFKHKILSGLLLASLLTSIRGHMFQFVTEPSDTIVENGHSAVLDCVLRTSSEYPQSIITIQWLDQDHQPINFEIDTYRSQLANGSLYISNVVEDLELTGTYQCAAKLPNVGHIVSRTARLSLANLSDFYKEPQNLTVSLGQKAYFACSIEASPSPRIRWLKDERPLQLEELRMTVLPSGALEIEEVLESDQGFYRCNASGLSSHKLSDKAILIVNNNEDHFDNLSPPNFIAQPQNKVVYAGQSVTLDCAANGNPTPNIKWLKNGYILDMADLDSRFSWVPSTTSLMIRNVEESDGGTYDCRAENREDSSDAYSTLEVQVPPRFLKKPEDTVSLVKKDIELECNVYGKPKPKVMWLKNGKLVLYSDYYQLVNGYNLKISGLVNTDSGLFQCIAQNPAGNVQASAILKVIEPLENIPKISKKGSSRSHKKKNNNLSSNKSLNTSVLRNTNLTNKAPFRHAVLNDQNNAHIEYDPLSIFSSLRSSENSASSHNLGDILSAYTEPSSYSNPLVEDDSKGLEGLPGPPQDVKASIINARFVTLIWQPPIITNGEITSYSVYYRQEGSERERMQNTSRSHLENIGGLQPGRVYFFRVVAHNVRGSGMSSRSLKVITQSEEHVPSPPLDVHAFATGSQSIHVTWKEPEVPNGKIIRYIVYYMETTSSIEHHIETTKLECDLITLSIFTEYYIWVVAENRNGTGTATGEIFIKTFSAYPNQPPYNVTLEAAANSSIIVRWEPPPPEGCNGVITGYKLKFKKQGKKADTYTTPGNERVYLFDKLDRSSLYQVKIFAINVNGTGPGTEWHEIETYHNDLDESTVPQRPSPLRVHAMSDRIFVVWGPPTEQTVKIRDYIIGWGKGFPDNFTKTLPEKQRNYTIYNVEPNSEYVISLYAQNTIGAGEPVYSNVRTREEPPPEPLGPLIPPMGLKTHVSSATSILLYWTDTTLGKTQDVRDNRFYTVKCTDEKGLKERTLNVTRLLAEFNDLKPNTLYEFSVKLVKGRRESPWSMIATNATPNFAPKNLRISSFDDEGKIELSWQAPKLQNSFVTGYIILYTTNTSITEREWTPHVIKDDKHTCIIPNLKPSTTYYFKIQARNNKKEYGPFSSIVSYQTRADGRNTFSGPILLYLIIGAFLLVIITIALVVTILCCRRNDTSSSPQSLKKGYQKSSQQIKPPDLWIHHDQMELKALEKTHSTNDGASSSGAMTLPRSIGANEYDSHESHHSNSLDKRSYVPNYMGNSTDDKNKRLPKTKPITLRVESKPFKEPIATATPINSNINQTSSDSTSSSRPSYPRTQYTISRAHVTVDANNMSNNQITESPYVSHTLNSYDSNSSNVGYVSHQPPPASHTSSNSNYAPGMSVLAESQGGKRIQGQGHPLKSFSVPAPPPISAPGTPQAKHIVSAQPQVTIRPTSSPYKKLPLNTNTSMGTPPSRISASNPPPYSVEEVQPLHPSHSTEELNQEMANLEGLMLTLNAITASEFEC